MTVANVLTPIDGELRTTFKRDISPTVDVCGVEDKGGDVSVVAFTKAGEELLTSDDQGGEAEQSRAFERLELALSAARAEKKANGGKFPSARELQRAIVLRTDDDIKVRRAKRLSGVKVVDAVYIVGKPRAHKLRLATRTDSGTMAELRISKNEVRRIGHSPQD